MATVFIRSVLLYFLLILSIRFTGKRQIGQLQPTELVLTILISNIAVMPIENTGIPILAGVVPIVTIVCLEVILSFFASRFPMFNDFIAGKPRVLIDSGTICQKEMKRMRLSPSILLEQLRQNNIYEIRDTSLAVVETGGNFSAADSTNMNSMPKIQIIENGHISKHLCKYCGVDREWIDQTLMEENTDLADVYVMTCNKKKEYTLIRKDQK